MFDLTKAKLQNSLKQTYVLKDRGFIIEFKTYDERSGGIKYSHYNSQNNHEIRRDWWIWNIKFEFMGNKIGNFDGGFNLIDIQNRLNISASDFIRKTYKDFI